MARITKRKVDTGIEKRIITGMIISDQFLKDIQSAYQPDFFKNDFTRTVASWCLDHFDQYQKSPGRHIQDIFDTETRHNDYEPEFVELIEDFLDHISNEFEKADKYNIPYLVDETVDYFKKESILALSKNLRTVTLGPGGPAEAEKLLTDYKIVQRELSEWVAPLTDRDGIRHAFEHEAEPLYRLPGALHKLFGPMERDGLLGILGPEKRGKTFWCIQFALWGLRARINTAFFAVGDMSKDQMYRRIHVNIAGRNYKERYCGDVVVPVMDCLWNQLNTCDDAPTDIKVVKDEKTMELYPFDSEEAKGYEPCTDCRSKSAVYQRWKGAVWNEIEYVKPLNWQEAYRTGIKFDQRIGKGRFRLSVHPADSISVDGCERQLEIWRDVDGWIPDQVIIDYPDICAPCNPQDPFRHQKNKTWLRMRGLSTRWHCLVVAPTQSDIAGADQFILTEKNFSEDKRYAGHVNIGIGTLNQTKEEKRRGIMRMGRIYAREDDFDVERTVTVLQCLAKGRPYIDSFL